MFREPPHAKGLGNVWVHSGTVGLLRAVSPGTHPELTRLPVPSLEPVLWDVLARHMPISAPRVSGGAARKGVLVP